jgi:DNA-binding winged helix-turn-helix (wHTH) protein
MAETLSILLLSDVKGRCLILAEQLVLDPDFSVSIAQKPYQFERPLDVERVDLVLGFEGLSAKIPEVQALGYRGPFLQLGHSPELGQDIETLDLPLRASALIGRIRSLVRTFKVREDPWLTIGPYRLSQGTRMLEGPDGQSEKLTDKEADFLSFMHRARGEIVSRDVLLAEIWGYNAQVTTHTLETHIYRLRQKIEKDPANAQLLITEPGGYRLIERTDKAHSNGD